MKRHGDDIESSLPSEKKQYEGIRDRDTLETQRAKAQWEDAYSEIINSHGQETFKNFLINFNQALLGQNYATLNQFLNKQADILANVPLDALCEQSAGVYQVKPAHFPAIAQQIQEEVALYTDAATYDLFQGSIKEGPSLPSDTSDSSYSPREAFSPLPTREFSRRTHQLKEIIHSDNAIKRILDRLAA